MKCPHSEFTGFKTCYGKKLCQDILKDQNHEETLGRAAIVLSTEETREKIQKQVDTLDKVKKCKGK